MALFNETSTESVHNLLLDYELILLKCSNLENFGKLWEYNTMPLMFSAYNEWTVYDGYFVNSLLWFPNASSNAVHESVLQFTGSEWFNLENEMSLMKDSNVSQCEDVSYHERLSYIWICSSLLSRKTLISLNIKLSLIMKDSCVSQWEAVSYHEKLIFLNL